MYTYTLCIYYEYECDVEVQCSNKSTKAPQGPGAKPGSMPSLVDRPVVVDLVFALFEVLGIHGVISKAVRAQKPTFLDLLSTELDVFRSHGHLDRPTSCDINHRHHRHHHPVGGGHRGLLTYRLPSENSRPER